MCTTLLATWLDAQHQYEAIALSALRRTALHAVDAIVAIAATAATGRTPAGSRTGLSTAGNSMAHVAAKLAELVAV